MEWLNCSHFSFREKFNEVSLFSSRGRSQVRIETKLGNPNLTDFTNSIRSYAILSSIAVKRNCLNRGLPQIQGGHGLKELHCDWLRLGSFRKNGLFCLLLAAVSIFIVNRARLVCHHSRLRWRQHGGDACGQLDTRYPFKIAHASEGISKTFGDIHANLSSSC